MIRSRQNKVTVGLGVTFRELGMLVGRVFTISVDMNVAHTVYNIN